MKINIVGVICVRGIECYCTNGRRLYYEKRLVDQVAPDLAIFTFEVDAYPSRDLRVINASGVTVGVIPNRNMLK